MPACTGMVCGDDGCGGVCGVCPTGQTCGSGQCTGGTGGGGTGGFIGAPATRDDGCTGSTPGSLPWTVIVLGGLALVVARRRAERA